MNRNSYISGMLWIEKKLVHASSITFEKIMCLFHDRYIEDMSCASSNVLMMLAFLQRTLRKCSAEPIPHYSKLEGFTEEEERFFRRGRRKKLKPAGHFLGVGGGTGGSITQTERQENIKEIINAFVFGGC